MTVQSAKYQVQTAMIALLAPSGIVETTLASLGVLGVFDMNGVPQNQAFPYVVLGDAQEIPKNAFARRGYIVNAKIHIWSQQRGDFEASPILERVNQLIDQQPLSLSTHTHVYTMYEGTSWISNDNIPYMHLTAKYQVYTQEG